MRWGLVVVAVAVALLLLTLIVAMTAYARKRRRRTHVDKDAVFYCYYERDDLYRENFRYFLEHVVGKPEHQDTTDFFIIINGECSVPLPDRPNTLIIRRENKGFDFGGYSHAVSNHVVYDYNYYFFINSSVRGPIPPQSDWKKAFKALFHEETNVGIVGVSINMLETLPETTMYKRPIVSHVQSMFFVLNGSAFQHLCDKKHFFADEDELNRITNIRDIVIRKEIAMSQLLLDAGYNLNCILSHYKDKDYRTLQYNINPSCDDPYFDGCYFGGDIQPEDAVFHKISRVPQHGAKDADHISALGGWQHAATEAVAAQVLVLERLKCAAGRRPFWWLHRPSVPAPPPIGSLDFTPYTV